MQRSIIASTTALLTLTASAALADGHANVSGYALAGDGQKLVVMDSIAEPSTVATFDLATPLRSIAWRPVTGELLGYADGSVVAINTSTGEIADLGAKFMDDAMIEGDAMVTLDFNNKIDAVRAVSTAGDNLVYFPDGFGDGDEKAGSVRRFTSLAYAEDDAMAGSTPMVFANAYTNAINGKTAGGTFQYALDAGADTLISLDNNAGTLKTVGKLTVDGEPIDIAPMGGFDIVSPAEGEDMAYAILTMEGAENAGLYVIDLESGAATMLADLGMGGVSGFAASLGM